MESESYILLLNILTGLDTGVYFAMLAGSFILLLFCGLISGSQAAFLSLYTPDIEKIQNRKDHRSRMILRMLDMPDRLLATIVTTKIFITALVYMLATIVVLHFFGMQFWIVLLAFFLLSGLVMLINEKWFQVVASKNAFQYAYISIYPLYVLKSLLYPVYYVFIHSDTNLNSKIIQTKYKITLEDLANIMDVESVSSKDTRLIKGILNFGDTDVKEIMRSRVDVTAVDEKTSFDELNQTIIESGYSRIPVYSESFDNIRGVLFVKDLWPYLEKKKDDFEWQKLIRPAYFVPENKKINELLKDFQRHKNHLAIVNDEYGGTYGIVTLEDVLEEIVGEISDESDDEELFYSKIDEQNYLFEGKTLLNDFYRILDISDEIFDEVKGDSDTLAGLILDIKGEMPLKDEIIDYERFQFKIESVDKRRIKQIRVTIIPERVVNEKDNL
ncbi:MAG: gliding motility-associated protein GldE [Bacteroidota bacterium]